ncbi:hypothetical protein BDA96_07G047900 [Sorghum bicolor]|uniref:Uncharacterized protein n=1 Tax=Sorghum bicolor TaxID=4558 RepID=A0A921QKL1_SORBI|nr:hypothetical protein BDA96_07G047900 [Sorghum bicolor]
MAFYKYGLAFLAGTGFGAAMTTLRNSRCPLHKHDSCSCHRRRVVGAGQSPETGGRGSEEYYDDAQEKGKRCPIPRKDGKEEKKGDKSEGSSD